MKKISSILLSIAMIFTLFNFNIMAIENEIEYAENINVYLYSSIFNDTSTMEIIIDKQDSKTISTLESKDVNVTFVDSQNTENTVTFTANEDDFSIKLLKSDLLLPNTDTYTIKEIAFNDITYAKEKINNNLDISFQYEKNENSIHMESIIMDESNLDLYKSNGVFSFVIRFDKDITTDTYVNVGIGMNNDTVNNQNSNFEKISNNEVRISFNIEIEKYFSTSYYLNNINIQSNGSFVNYYRNNNIDLFEKLGVYEPLFSVEGGINDFSAPVLEKIDVDFTPGETIEGTKTLTYTLTLSNDEDINLSSSESTLGIKYNSYDSIYHNLNLRSLGNHKYELKIYIDSNSLAGEYSINMLSLRDQFGNCNYENEKFNGLYFYVNSKVDSYIAPTVKTFDSINGEYRVDENNSVIFEAEITGQVINTSIEIENKKVLGIKTAENTYQYTVSKDILDDGIYEINSIHVNGSSNDLSAICNKKMGVIVGESIPILEKLTLSINKEVKPGDILKLDAKFSSDILSFNVNFMHKDGKRSIYFSDHNIINNMVSLESAIMNNDLNGQYVLESITYTATDGSYHYLNSNHFLLDILGIKDSSFIVSGASDDATPPEIAKVEVEENQNTTFTSPGRFDFYIEFSEPIDLEKCSISISNNDNGHYIYTDRYEVDAEKNRYLFSTQITETTLDGFYSINNISIVDKVGNSINYWEGNMPTDLSNINFNVNIGYVAPIDPKLINVTVLNDIKEVNSSGEVTIQFEFDQPVKNLDASLDNTRYQGVYGYSTLSFSSSANKVDDYKWNLSFKIDDKHVKGVYKIGYINGSYGNNTYFSISSYEYEKLFEKSKILINIGLDKLNITKPKLISVVKENRENELTEPGTISYIVKTNENIKYLNATLSVSGTQIKKDVVYYSDVGYGSTEEDRKVEKINDKEYRISFNVSNDSPNGKYIISNLGLSNEDNNFNSYSIYDRNGFVYLSKTQIDVSCGINDKIGPRILKVSQHEDNKEIYDSNMYDTKFKFYIETDEPATGIASFISNSSSLPLENSVSRIGSNLLLVEISPGPLSSNSEINEFYLNQLTLTDVYGNQTKVDRGNVKQYDLDQLKFKVKVEKVDNPIIKDIKQVTESNEFQKEGLYQTNITFDRKVDNIYLYYFKEENNRASMGGIAGNKMLESYYELISANDDTKEYVYAVYTKVNKENENGVYLFSSLSFNVGNNSFNVAEYGSYVEEYLKYKLDESKLIVNIPDGDSVEVNKLIESVTPLDSNVETYTTSGVLGFELTSIKNRAFYVEDGYLTFTKNNETYTAYWTDPRGTGCTGPVCQMKQEIRFAIDEKFDDGSYQLKSMHLFDGNGNELIISDSTTKSLWERSKLDKISFEAKGIVNSETQPFKILSFEPSENNQAIYTKEGTAKYIITTNKKIKDISLDLVTTSSYGINSMQKYEINKISDRKYEIFYKIDKTWKNGVYYPGTIWASDENGKNTYLYSNFGYSGFEVKCGKKNEGTISLLDYESINKQYNTQDNEYYEAIYTFNKPIEFESVYFTNANDYYISEVIAPEIVRVSETVYKVRLKIDESIDEGDYVLYAQVSDGYNTQWIESGNNKKFSVVNPSAVKGELSIQPIITTADENQVLKSNEWSNQPIMIDVFKDHNEEILVSEDGKNWKEYDPTQVHDSNKKLYLKSKNEEGKESSVKVINIKVDQELPNCLIALPSRLYRMRNYSVGYNISLNASDDVSGVKAVQYALVEEGRSLEEGNWNNGGLIKVPANFSGTLYARSIDNAGNVSEIQSEKLTAKATLSFDLEGNTESITEDTLKVKNIQIDEADSITNVSIQKNANEEEDITSSYENGYSIKENGTYTITIETAAGATLSKSISYANIGRSELRFVVSGNTTNTAFEDTMAIDIVLINDNISKVEIVNDDAPIDITDSYMSGYTVSENGTYTVRLTTENGKVETRSIIYSNLIKYTEKFDMVLDYDNENYLSSDTINFVFGTIAPTKITISYGINVVDITNTYQNGYVINENGTYKIHAESSDGESVDKAIIYSNIDNVIPEITLTGDNITPNIENDLLNVDITAGISGIDYVTIQKGNGGVSFVADYASGISIDSNGTYTITAYSKAGLSSSKTITYTNFVNKLSKGDLNGDGEINSADAQLILQYSIDLISLSSDQLLVADINQDGFINSADAQLILQYSIGLIPEL